MNDIQHTRSRLSLCWAAIRFCFISQPCALHIAFQLRIQTRRLGEQLHRGSQKGLHLLKYQRLSATVVGHNKKVVTFCRPKSGYFCWSNYAIFQGITTVWKHFISLIQKTFETGPKQWSSFFTSYTYLAVPSPRGGLAPPNKSLGPPKLKYDTL